MSRFDIKETPIKGVFEAFAKPALDERGSFERLFCAQDLIEAGYVSAISQINLSCNNKKGTVRGLHFQKPPRAEIKFVRCTRGKIFDVAVDLRSGSSTFLKYIAFELSEEKRNCLILPKGVAHGFQTLTERADILYLVSEPFSPDCDGRLNPFDPMIKIDWPLEVSSISDKDRTCPFMQDNYEGLNISQNIDDIYIYNN